MAHRVNEDRAIVDDCVAIIARHAEFSWDFVIGHAVIGHALGGKNGADADLITITIGRMVLAHDIFVEARPLIDPEETGNATGYAAPTTPPTGPAAAAPSAAPRSEPRITP